MTISYVDIATLPYEGRRLDSGLDGSEGHVDAFVGMKFEICCAYNRANLNVVWIRGYTSSIRSAELL